MATTSNTPKFQHDCDCCTFLKHVQPRTGAAFDLYCHEGTALARTGDDGPDYHSMPLSYAPHLMDKLDSTMGQAFWMYEHLTKRRFPKLRAA
jgi:hypothetical protein